MMKTLITLLLLAPIYSVASINFGDYSLEQKLDWEMLNLKNNPDLKAAFKSPSKRSIFTVREFNNIKETSLKKNAASWAKDYTSYGLRITDSKPIKLKDGTYVYYIEAVHNKTNKIFSQYMSIKDRKLITLTCQSGSHNKELKDCKNTLKSFTWKTETNH